MNYICSHLCHFHLTTLWNTGPKGTCSYYNLVHSPIFYHTETFYFHYIYFQAIKKKTWLAHLYQKKHLALLKAGVILKINGDVCRLPWLKACLFSWSRDRADPPTHLSWYLCLMVWWCHGGTCVKRFGDVLLMVSGTIPNVLVISSLEVENRAFVSVSNTSQSHYLPWGVHWRQWCHIIWL